MFENFPVDFIEAQQQIYRNPLEGADIIKLHYLIPYQENKCLSKNDFDIKGKKRHFVFALFSSFHDHTKE